MLLHVCLGFALLAATPVWSQLGVIPYETSTATADGSQMETPPAVDGEVYPTVVGSEMRSNFMSAGLILDTSYHDNIFVGGSTTPVGDIAYSILPTITLDQKTPRQQLTLTYSPGYTFYQRTSALNASTQTAVLNYQYRLSQHLTIHVSDLFQKSPTIFNQLYPLSGPGISGSAQPSSAEVFAPYANPLTNTATAGVTYQFSRNDMIGADGIVTGTSYSNPAEAAGFYDSTSRGGSVFYSRRISSTQYTGVLYQYVNSHSSPVGEQADFAASQTNVQTHTILGFYTIYLTPTVSVSLSCGPQYSEAIQYPVPPVVSWTPSVRASIGWQTGRTNLVARYSRTITGGTGLSGAFESNSVNTSARWRMARRWTAQVVASYFSYKNSTPLFSSSSLDGGHTFWGTISLEHPLSEKLKVELRYAWLQQSNNSIATISAAPVSNNETVSISYQFSRALGR